ncbi:MAG: hypothetical protein KJZ64_10165 [Sphingomonadaceae bacterium]|nr:hypothetical protein [Sphingomonadaceae bacterium]
MKKAPPFPKPTEQQLVAAAELAFQDCFARGPARTEIREAIEKLNARLIDNANLYLQGNLQDQRDALADTLLAVEDFLADQGIARMALVPLLRPVQALVEREDNSLDPLFCERARTGTPKRTLNRLVRTGILAAFAKAWLEAHAGDGRNQQLLLAEAARSLKGPWFAGVTRAKLKTARDLVNQEASDHPSVMQANSTQADIARAAEMYGAKAAIFIVANYYNNCPPHYAFGSMGISKTHHVSPSAED